jgi:hypothetical protein
LCVTSRSMRIAVVAVWLDGEWIVLDNRRLTLVADVDMRRMVPLFVFTVRTTASGNLCLRRRPPEFSHHRPGRSASVRQHLLGFVTLYCSHDR